MYFSKSNIISIVPYTQKHFKVNSLAIPLEVIDEFSLKT